MHKLSHIFPLIIFCLVFIQNLNAQNNTEDSIKKSETKTELRKNFKKQGLIQSGVTVSQIIPAFYNSNQILGKYNSVRFQDKFFELAYMTGKTTKPSDYYAKISDTIGINELSIGVHIPLKKLMIGHRLWDINGVLFVPAFSVLYTKFTSGNQNTSGLRLSPTASIQFPYFGIEARLNADYRFNADKVTGLNKFSFSPEIGIKFDGLFSVFDPELVFTGHREGYKTSKSTRFETKNWSEGSGNDKVYYEETYQITTTSVEHFSFDDYARNVGPFAAIAPHYTYNNHAYSGKTRMYGLGYHVRVGTIGIDLMADAGKLGFASSYNKVQTIDNPIPKEHKINKKDYRFTGTYNASKVTARVGIDAVELFTNLYYGKPTGGVTATKFTRLNFGVGFGFLQVGKPTYDRSYALSYKDSVYLNNYTILSTSRNDAKFADNSIFFTYFISFETGSVMMSLEGYRYKFAGLSNAPTFSVAYLLPYNRLIKKYKALHAIKKYLRS